MQCESQVLHHTHIVDMYADVNKVAILFNYGKLNTVSHCHKIISSSNSSIQNSLAIKP